MPAVLSLVRHGRTEANANGLLLGRLDPSLDDVGRWQVGRLAGALGPVDRVVSSPLLRAQETAAALGAPVEVDERVIELDYGGWDGLPVADVKASSWSRWRDDARFSPPGGESLHQLSARVTAAMAELADEARNRHVVVVSHVLPIKAAVTWALGVGIEAVWRLYLDQASITRIAIGPSGPVVRAYNDVAHLTGGPSPS
jgi:broad specificity phosphatase PhoE